jgi:hypothetical protein
VLYGNIAERRLHREDAGVDDSILKFTGRRGSSRARSGRGRKILADRSSPATSW